MPQDELRDLILHGRLKIGTALTHPGRAYPDAHAIVVEGGIKVRNSVYTTPSAAARAITGRPVDGWGFWRLPNGERLDSLRPPERQTKWISPSQRRS